MIKSKDQGKTNLIERILHQYYHQKKSIQEIADMEHCSIRTVYRWLKIAKSGNISRRSQKPNLCQKRSIFPNEVWNRIVDLKQENSKRTAQIISDLLIKEGFSKIPSLTSIRRHLLKKGLGRISTEYRRGYNAFERESPNELWQIDIAGAQTIGHLGSLFLFTLLDDCSRFVVAAFYTTDQKSGHVIELLRQAISKYGRPLEILADNGTQFKNILGNLGSKYERILKLLDIRPVFARARHPQTKGKLERFFGTVKTMFLSEVRYQIKQDPTITLTEFNQMLQKWIEFYNTKHRHRGLPNRSSPSKVYFGKQNRIDRPLEVQLNWDRWIVERETRKVTKSNLISYHGQQFAIPPGYAGLEVEIWISPSKIDIFRGQQCIISHSKSPSSSSRNKTQTRKIFYNGSFGYKGKYYYISYKMKGQQILVRESADGQELYIYHQNKLLMKLPV